jgi:hypothetical protein
MFRAQLVRGQAPKRFIDEMARLTIYGAYPEDIKARCGTVIWAWHPVECEHRPVMHYAGAQRESPSRPTPSRACHAAINP